MKVLQDGLTDYSVSFISMRLALAEEITKASPLPVTIWNPPADGKKLTNSPTRCLWMFLPRQAGGLDEQGRILAYIESRLPLEIVHFNLARVGVNFQNRFRGGSVGQVEAHQ